MRRRRPTAAQERPQIDSIGPTRGIIPPRGPGAAEGKITAERAGNVARLSKRPGQGQENTVYRLTAAVQITGYCVSLDHLVGM